MANFPNTFAPELQLLTPEMDLSEANGNQALGGLLERGYVVAYGLPKEFVGAIGATAFQPGIVEYCPKDKDKRFATIGSTGEWLQKGGGRGMVWVGEVFGGARDGARIISPDLASITSDDVRLVAYGWAGNEKNERIPGADTTFAVRVGEQAKRKGLAKPLSRLIIATSVSLWDVDPNTFSLETFESNFAEGIYCDVGFCRLPGLKPIPVTRPTLEPVGAVINGHTVYEAFDEATGATQNWVEDRRIIMAYRSNRDGSVA